MVVNTILIKILTILRNNLMLHYIIIVNNHQKYKKKIRYEPYNEINQSI